MNNNNKITIKERVFRNKYLNYGIVLIIGLLIGWILFGNSSASVSNKEEHVHEASESQVWTCSMHPQIRMDEPGKCPLCAMDLIPVTTSGGGEAIDPNAIQMSEESIALSNIQTTIVNRQNPTKTISLYGTIQIDERASQSQTSHVRGRIEKLLVNFTGESVKEGQPIAILYSPEVMLAQQELIEGKKLEDVQPSLIEAAKEKMRLWKFSEEQINDIESSGKVTSQIEIRANTTGVVVGRNVSQGDYIEAGAVLMDVANLSQVWAMFDAYESDLPFLKVGDKLEFTLQSVPGKTFSGQISFIDPLLDKTSRTSKIRVVVSNPSLQLKPEMYATAKITSSLKQYDNEIVIPKSAVLWTGKRSIVYVRQPVTETPAFMLREVELGPSLGDAYVALSGLKDGEEIVTNGVFSIDATAQLEGKRSMMSLNDAHDMHADHDHHDHATVPEDAKHISMKVGGLCGMCKDRIEKTAKEQGGVYTASWDSESQKLHLQYNSDKVSVDKISKALAKVGHDTEFDKADDKVYEALPACCHYRK